MPARLQRLRTKGYRAPKHSVYVGRPTRFGNPFHIAPAASERGGPLDMWAVTYQARTLGRFDDKAAARADAVDRYARWIREPEQADALRLFRALLYGRDLTCWCPPDHPCHADVLLEISNQESAP